MLLGQAECTASGKQDQQIWLVTSATCLWHSFCNATPDMLLLYAKSHRQCSSDRYLWYGKYISMSVFTLSLSLPMWGDLHQRTHQSEFGWKTSPRSLFWWEQPSCPLTGDTKHTDELAYTVNFISPSLYFWYVLCFYLMCLLISIIKSAAESRTVSWLHALYHLPVWSQLSFCSHCPVFTRAIHPCRAETSRFWCLKHVLFFFRNVNAHFIASFLSYFQGIFKFCISRADNAHQGLNSYLFVIISKVSYRHLYDTSDGW